MVWVGRAAFSWLLLLLQSRLVLLLQDDLLQCKLCNYYCASRKLLSFRWLQALLKRSRNAMRHELQSFASS